MAPKLLFLLSVIFAPLLFAAWVLIPEWKRRLNMTPQERKAEDDLCDEEMFYW